MSLVCLGINHQTAPSALRERVCLSHGRMEQFLSNLRDEAAVREVVGLSTCNRTEVYMSAEEPLNACSAALRHLGADADHEQALALQRAFYMHLDDAAAEHLFRVSSGIDSLILGEAQILGQLRKAFELARALGTSGECLNSLLNRAISFGRRVRVETAIGRGNMSVASVACRIALEWLEALGDKELLILGAGETAQLAGRHFVKEKAGRIRVLNRTLESAQSLASELGGEAVPIDHLQTAIATADVILCAIGAPHFIITREGVARTMLNRPDHPLLLIDLSMPRNIDPEAGTIEGVTLYAIDNLEEIVQGNRANREGEIIQVEQLVKKETRKYLDWTLSSEQNQVVTSLRRQVADIQQRALDRHFRSADPFMREQLHLFTDSVLRAAFHDVTEYIRNLDTQSEQGRLDLQAIRRIFALDESLPVEREGTVSEMPQARVVDPEVVGDRLVS